MGEISFETFGRKAKSAGNALQDGTARLVLSESADLASAVSGVYRAATGGDGRLSGTAGIRKGNGRAAPVSAKAKPVRKYSEGTYVGLVVPTGPWALIERDMPAHAIAPGLTLKERRGLLKKARRAGRGSGYSAVRVTQLARAGLAKSESKALSVPGNYTPKKGKATGVFAVVNHPGTTGRPVFSRSIAAIGPTTARGLCVKSVKKMTDGYRAGK